ncbi:hypothetical protein [Methylobacterium iners]|uniref:Uncharacterized protein n=1 Tax=Methylobacterium iners TaxID=418707 RepID=A0ABQ4RRV7_9HYPH|nr:hypothetical protein [Methylobacterium iners]GJD92917.1 hypothetical protein OCOJLMKI_0100 [Methylobacterium iners]
MDTTDSFAPKPKGTIAIAATVATAATALATNDQVRIVNNGPSDCRVEFGKADTVAATKPVVGGALGSVLLKAGTVEIFSVPPNTTHIATLGETGNAALEVTPGVGL